MPGLIDRLLNARIPLGNIGPDNADLNHWLTDVRTNERPLPDDFSLAELGGLLSYLPQAVSRENVINSTYDAIGGREYGTGRELGLIERFAGLFPAGGAQGGGAIAPAGSRGSTTLGAAIIRNADEMPPRLPTEGFGSVFPKPQRMYDPTAPDYPPGGQYLSMPGKTDITGTTPAQAHIGISPEGKPVFKVSGETRPDAPTKAEGAQVKTNLFKQSAGWKWTSRNEGVPDTQTLVSIETGGKHYYTLATDYPQGLNLARYPDAPHEPRLRPTAHGDVDLGPRVGTISVRGREHPVYERAVIRPKGTALDERIVPGSDISPGSSVTPPGKHPLVGTIYQNNFQAGSAWMAAGGKQSGLKVTPLPDGTFRMDEAPSPSAVAPGVPVPGSVGPSGGLPPSPSVANTGGPVVSGPAGTAGTGGTGSAAVPPFVGRPAVPPPPGSVPAGALTDPEGRVLTAPTIAGVRTPGGPDVPLSMAEERTVAADLFNLGLFDDPNFKYNTGYNGQASVMIPGDPATRPMMRMTMDSQLPGDQYMRTFRHEGGHGIDFASERTARTAQIPQHEIPNIPPALLPELHAASAEMRPGLWQRPEREWIDYRQRPSELMADAYRFYKEDPAAFKALAPNAAKWLRDIVNDDPVLNRTIQFNVQAGGPLAGLIQVPLEQDTTDADVLRMLGLGPLAPGLMAVAREAGHTGQLSTN